MRHGGASSAASSGPFGLASGDRPHGVPSRAHHRERDVAPWRVTDHGDASPRSHVQVFAFR